MNRFDHTFRDALKLEVQELEKETGAELVVALSPRVGRYFFSHVVFGTLTAFTLLTILMFIPQEIWFVKIYYETLIAFALGFLALYAMNPLKRLIQGRKYMRTRVKDRAVALYHEAKVHRTQHYTGVLIFVAFFEREVVIVADEGAETSIPAAEWEIMKNRFAKTFTAKHPPDAIIEAIRESAPVFAHHIPQSGDDINELPDEIWVH